MSDPDDVEKRKKKIERIFELQARLVEAEETSERISQKTDSIREELVRVINGHFDENNTSLGKSENNNSNYIALRNFMIVLGVVFSIVFLGYLISYYGDIVIRLIMICGSVLLVVFLVLFYVIDNM